MTHKTTLLARALCAFGMLCAALPASAAAPVTLLGDVKAEKTVIEDGVSKTVLVEPDVVVPVDRLLFSTAFSNTGSEAVENFVLTNPLPAAVTLAPEEAGTLVVSVDGGKSFGTLSELTVTDPEGQARPAQASDVTHIRAVIASIKPGSGGSFQYHAIVR